MRTRAGLAGESADEEIAGKRAIVEAVPKRGKYVSAGAELTARLE